MNSAINGRKRQKPARLTSIILLVSLIILSARLLYVVPEAIRHYQQKNTLTAPTASSVTTM